ncbi:DinB family protein [Paenibacillus campi]|uniref:DinB family protein n=1 Tax=Paenibacillus campi TaxID=3106031 RepID=UPI002AFE868E|nr:DinB family protein [Paenibacillus sp. SGZ-1009]
MENAKFGSLFLEISVQRMCELYRHKFSAALEHLTAEQLWIQPYDNANTTGGIVMHVIEHIHRNVLRLNERESLLPSGFSNYFPDTYESPQAVMAQLDAELAAWRDTITRLLDNPSTIQPDHLHDIYHLVEHTSYHLGQILDRTRAATGTEFNFAQNGLNERNLRSQIEHNRRRQEFIARKHTPLALSTDAL